MGISARSALLAALVLVAIAFTAFACSHLRRARAVAPTPWMIVIGFVTNFFDTLGIGSYATTTTLWRARGTVDDRLLPGTLNVGHAWPTFAQAAIFLVSVRVGEGTLAGLVGASVVGAWVGAGVAAQLPRRRVQLVVGLGLAAAAALMGAGLLGVLPVGGDALALEGPRLAIGAAACATFGALMTFGIGAYAPIMITVALLGMNPAAAFPIMMGACAFLMPAANVRFLQAGAYDPRAALGLTLGGVPGVLVAAWVVRSLPTTTLKVLVIAVATHAAWRLFAAARAADSDA